MGTGILPKQVEIVLERPKIKETLKGKTIKKIIYIPNKLVNIITD